MAVCDRTSPTYFLVNNFPLSTIGLPNPSAISCTIRCPFGRNLTDQELEKEIAQSKAIYEERLGGKRPFFSYPMGHYDARVIKMIRKHGYTMAFSVSERGFYAQPPQYSIPRIYMGTIMEDLNLFQYCVENYSAIDPNCFEERWKPLEKPN